MNEFNIDDNGLRIGFYREPGADRWRLTLSVLDVAAGADAWRPVLTSCADDADPTWPAFPPLQELLPGTHAGKPSVQLVGMAGKHHWSLSVAWQPELVRWLCDFACRCEQPPGPGIATFVTRCEALAQVDAATWVLPASASQRGIHITTSALPNVPTRLDCQPMGKSSGSTLTITSPAPTATMGRQTLRWCFGID